MTSIVPILLAVALLEFGLLVHAGVALARSRRHLVDLLRVVLGALEGRLNLEDRIARDRALKAVRIALEMLK